jgi:hypothetical protein
MKKPAKKRNPIERYVSDEREERAIRASENFEGHSHRPEHTYMQRLKDGFKMLHYDE